MHIIYLIKDDYQMLKRAFSPKAVCEKCGGEMTFVVKKHQAHRVLFYLCQDPDCAHNTEPCLINVL